jgi:hypothetical protein
MQLFGSTIENSIDPFSVDSAQRAVQAGTCLESGRRPNGCVPVPLQMRASSETHTGIPPEDTWNPFTRFPTEQAVSCTPSSGIGRWVGIYPTIHEPGRSKLDTHWIGEPGEDVALGIEGMNEAE